MTVFGQVSLGLAVVKKLVLQLGALVSKIVEAVAKRALKSYIGTKSDMYSGKNFLMLFLKYLCILNGRGINGSPTTSLHGSGTNSRELLVRISAPSP